MSLSGNSIFLKTFHYLRMISLFCVKKCPYSEFLWSKYGKIRTRKTPNLKPFHEVKVFRFWPILCWCSNLFKCFPVFYNAFWKIERNWSVCTKWVISHHLSRLILIRIVQKKWSFPLRISSVYVNKSAWNCRFGHIYWRNSQWKTSFFGAVYSVSLN